LVADEGIKPFPPAGARTLDLADRVLLRRCPAWSCGSPTPARS